ncbi:MAG: response regulator [Lutibacter sp.]|nr:response regulator [Lutibacter sp.]
MKENIKIEKLKLSELLLNKVNLIVVSCTENSDVNYISPATENIIGYKTNDLLGNQWWDLTFFSKEEGEKFKKKVNDLTSQKIILDRKPYERKLRCKDGSAKWIEWRDSIGEGNTFVSVGVDIDYWKKAEQEKIQSDTIIKNMDSMVVVSNVEGNLLFASPSVEVMLGYTSGEILGDKWWNVTFENPYEAIKVRNAIKKFILYNESDYIDISKRKIKTKAGNFKWIEWQISKGINDTYISVGRDITDRMLSEVELKKAKDFAEESLKVKSEFLANMSHEIRTPLNSIIGFTDLLLESKITSEQQLHLETMKNSGEILLSLINNVLDLSKLDSDKFVIEEVSFNLHKNLNEVVRLMKIKADEKNISLELIIDPSTPKQVIGDSNRLGQILLNLIGNAVKFTNEGSVLIFVKKLSEKNDIAKVTFEIKDTGIGIVSNKINTVFGAFSQAKSDTSRIYGGTGLGLTIVKKLINLLKGEIKVESKFGEGSVFKITLPLKKSEEVSDEQTIENKLLDQPLDLNILLVDDNKTNQLLGKTRLERWNCKVDLASNGIESVKMAQQNMYDVILMDIQMPIMDGYEATKIIKNDISAEVSKIPIIAMSAYTSASDVERALSAGMDDYIFKPFKPNELYNVLEKYGKVNKVTISTKVDNFKGKATKEGAEKYADLKFLREETFNEKSLLVLLINSFLAEIEEFIDVVNKEMKNKNWILLHKAVHKIKPSVSMFGISKLELTIQMLVNNLRKEEQLESVEERINSCIEIFKLVKVELLTELKSLENE